MSARKRTSAAPGTRTFLCLSGLYPYIYWIYARRESRVGRGMSLAQIWIRMDIRFISSLTAEDENVFAPALLKAVGAILDQFPIAYTLRVETTGAQVFQHTHHSFDTTSTPAVPSSVNARLGSLA